MKKIYLIVTVLFLFLTGTAALMAEESGIPVRFGLVANYYNEPAVKPGFTLGMDWEYSLNENHKLGLTLPEFTCFYFPDNYYALYFYPEAAYRYISTKGFYTALSLGGGLSLSRKTVPVYNLQGSLVDDSFTKQLFLTAQLAFGADLSRSRHMPLPCRIYMTLGWKGLYPNNLGMSNQILLQAGMNYRLAGIGS